MPPLTTPSARARSVTWAWLVGGAVALAAVWSVLNAWTAAPAGHRAPIALHTADLMPGAVAARAASRRVTLPDTWARHSWGAAGRARYRADFDLASAPAEVWALRIDRLSTHHAVRVNGTLVHGTLDAPQNTLRRPVPTLIALPAGILRAGSNEIEIDVDHGARGGLSPLLLGPMQAIEPGFLSGQQREIGLPQALNVISVGACLVALLVWWRRRGEVALGTFAALGLLASLRNVAYFEVDSPLPPAVSDWLFFVTQIACVVLVGLFALAVSQRSSPRLRAAWLAGGALLTAIGTVAAAGDWLQQARAWFYPPLLLALMAAIAWMSQAVRRLPGASLALLVAGLAAVCGAGVHDYFYQQGYTSVMDTYWMPYAVPLAVLAFAGLLVRRVVDAMHQVEELNLDLEQRVQQRTTELERANAAKGRFLAAASHDLRQPVAAIGLFVGLLREQAGTPRWRDLVDRVDHAVAALESLLKGLLDLSRLDAGTVQPRTGRVALQSLFDAIAAHEGSGARAKGIVLRFRATSLHAVSDPVLLEQILRNLVGNAVRCTTRGGVLVTARPRGAQVLLQVWDTGCGMTPEQQSAAFEEFVQFHSAGEEVRGLGLGLAIVQRSARLLGHALTLRSEPGRGSCFSLVLPRDRRAAYEAAAVPVAAGLPLAGCRVLVVDDGADVREALRLRLEGWGAKVRSFAGLGPLRAARALGDPLAADLLLTDQRLPDGDGLAVIEWMRALEPGLPALVVTGDTLPSELARLARCGVPVLNKPFRAEALLAELQALAADERSPR